MNAKNQAVRVRVPGSTANLGPGFDTLGMALSLYGWIEMRISDRPAFTIHGDELKGIPQDDSNLVYQVAQTVFREAGAAEVPLEISMYSEIPLTRGLGSSATAIVGGMVAANALIGNPLSADELFQLATRLEDHPDNVGASLFGGIVVANWDGHRAEHIRLEPDDRLELLALIPDFHLSTSDARNVLPREVSFKDAVANIGHSSLLVAALATGNLPMLRHALRDTLHQPYRAKLVPGMERILREASEHGALGAVLSGAGPTLLALVDEQDGNKAALERFMAETMRSENVDARMLWLKPERAGAQILTPHAEHSTFIDIIQQVRGEVRT